MTFKEKYSVFQNTEFVTQMITKAVYDTMHLEGQGLSKKAVREIVEKVMKEPEPVLNTY